MELLLKAASELPDYMLKIVGTGPLENSLKSANKNKHIKFLGYKTGEELKSIISGSRFLVVPSNWFENNPLCELCMGVQCLWNIGIPELRIFTIFLFEPDNIRS